MQPMPQTQKIDAILYVSAYATTEPNPHVSFAYMGWDLLYMHSHA